METKAGGLFDATQFNWALNEIDKKTGQAVHTLFKSSKTFL
jgi:hypothetical protein